MSIANVSKIGDYFYFRAKIRGRCFYRSLPDPADKRFQRCYERAKRELDRLRSGASLDALIQEYRRSSAFRQLAQATRRNKERYFSLFSERFKELDVSELTRADVYAMQEDFGDSPGKANTAVAQLGVLLGYGMERGFCAENVAANIRRLKSGSHLAWPQHVIDLALKHASPMVRLAIVTGLETGQRIGDCLRITREQLEGGLVELVQQKTGARVFVPVTKRWLEEIALLPAKGPTILYSCYGRPFKTPDTLQAEIRTLLKVLGFPKYTFHGLRKNATNRLAESGLTPFEIGAVTGMTLPTVVHYTREVDNRRLAMAAASRIVP